MCKNNTLDELRLRAPAVAIRLEEEPGRYRVLPADSAEARAAVRWIEDHFPMQGERIKWSEVPSHKCVHWSQTRDLVDSFTQMAAGLSEDSELVITWADGSCPSIALQKSRLLTIATVVFEADFDTWVVCLAQGWCLEAHHDGTLCAAYRQ